MPDQVTLRFESTIESENSDPILLSGPIQIFATVDYKEDLESAEMALNINNTSTEEVSQIIVFVAHVEDYENSQTYRGAYFLLATKERNKDAYLLVSDWKEILLGTHSHDNLDALESISSLSEDGVVVRNNDGTFSTKKISDFLGETGSFLPAFPKEVQDRLDELNALKLKEPTDSEWHHLDADLSELLDPYDWLNPKDGKNLAIGNCRDLYRALTKADKKLYLNKDCSLSTTAGNQIGWLQLAVYSVDYNYGNVYENGETIVASKDTSSTNKLLLSLDLPWNILKNDILYFFDNNRLIKSFKVVSIDDKKLILRLPSAEFTGREEPSALTLLVVRDCSEDERELEYEIQTSIENGVLSLDDINRTLAKLYMEGELYRRPNLPKLYLTTDQYGTLHWENKFLPQQYFYTGTIIVDEEYIENNTTENGHLKLVFKDAYYDIKDYPLLMIDGVFAVDNQIYATAVGADLVYKVPMHDKIYDFELNPAVNKTKVNVGLVLIKNSASGSLANEIADRYISKEDAVAILSNGKVKLDDYATLTQLAQYTKIGHQHSEYALKGHNHDYRYANFYHSHEELFKITAELISGYNSGLSTEEIVATLQSLTQTEQNKYENYIRALLTSAGFVTNQTTGGLDFYDQSARLSSSTIDALNNVITNNGSHLPPLTEGAAVSDAISLLSALFIEDTVLDTQVILDNALPVRLVNGPIGGLTTNKVYKQGTTLQEILRDILNPYVNIEEMRKNLTPVDAIIHWYVKDSSDNYIEVDNNNLQYHNYVNDAIYFTYELRNEFNEPCEFTIYIAGEPRVLKPTSLEAIVDGGVIAAIADGTYYQYCSANLASDYPDGNYPNITITWDPNSQIFDNYGMSPDILGGSGSLVKENISFKVNYPDIYAGFASEYDLKFGLNIDGNSNFAEGYGSERFQITVPNGKCLVVLVEVPQNIDTNITNIEEKFRIFDKSIDITDYFTPYGNMEINNRLYAKFGYKISLGEDAEFNLFITSNIEQ